MNIPKDGFLPPHNAELEEAVLGAMILEPGSASRVSWILDERSFYKLENQLVFKSWERIKAKGMIPDLLLLSQDLRERNELDQAGGAYYLATLTSRVASSANIEYHARILSQFRASRELIRVGNELQSKGFSSGDQGIEALGWAQEELRNVSAGVFKKSASRFAEAWERAQEELNQPKSQRRGVNTGLRDLDQKCGILEPGTLTILGARPGMGKTALGLEIALRQSKQGKRIAFFSLEMPENQLLQRMISNQLRIPFRRIREQEFAMEEALQLFDQKPQDLPIFIDDTAAISPIELGAKIAQLKSLGPLDLVIVDYLQIMRGSGSKYASREAEVSSISRELKALSKQESVPIMALAQLSRETEKRTNPKPRLSDLRESGGIEQDADNIWFIYRPEYYLESRDPYETIELGSSGIHVPARGHVTILGAKYRQGSPFQAYLRSDLGTMRFFDGPPGYGERQLEYNSHVYPEIFNH